MELFYELYGFYEEYFHFMKKYLPQKDYEKDNVIFQPLLFYNRNPIPKAELLTISKYFITAPLGVIQGAFLMLKIMRKIQTIFDRNWKTDRKVNAKLVVDFDFDNAIATEKLDGMNIRLTIREGEVVRVEKRRNPNKLQKHRGILEPWYVDADEHSSQDKWIFDAVHNTNLKGVINGEWSAEAIGKNIQGNPLDLTGNEIFIFSLPDWRKKIILKDAPTTFDALKDYLINRKSKLGNNRSIEGIVWHHPNGDMVKIKRKDFL